MVLFFAEELEMAIDGSSEDVAKINGAPLPYEPPVLTAIGSLHDLLAGGGTQACDNSTISAGPTAAIPVPPFCV
jgi:hypothetical protein